MRKDVVDDVHVRLGLSVVWAWFVGWGSMERLQVLDVDDWVSLRASVEFEFVRIASVDANDGERTSPSMSQ